MIYVLTMLNEETCKHDLKLHGPFDDSKTAQTWGERWENANGECPLWQVLNLDNELFNFSPGSTVPVDGFFVTILAPADL